MDQVHVLVNINRSVVRGRASERTGELHIVCQLLALMVNVFTPLRVTFTSDFIVFYLCTKVLTVCISVKFILPFCTFVLSVSLFAYHNNNAGNVDINKINEPTAMNPPTNRPLYESILLSNDQFSSILFHFLCK